MTTAHPEDARCAQHLLQAWAIQSCSCVTNPKFGYLHFRHSPSILLRGFVFIYFQCPQSKTMNQPLSVRRGVAMKRRLRAGGVFLTTLIRAFEHLANEHLAKTIESM